ncbi:MAG: NAD(P)(+) transhydrogenase (Re/Si-specific) subunit beta [Candidatus Altiarchaeota archaeon]
MEPLSANAINFLYLISVVLFTVGLKMMSSPKTARNGNILGAVGMLIAIVATLMEKNIIEYQYIIAGLVVGSAIGAYMAKTVKMTGMPQMVAALNGFGGGASALVAMAEFVRTTAVPSVDVSATLVLSILVGMVTFTGSFIAFAKLQGLMRSAPIVFKFQQAFNMILLLVTLGIGVFFVLDPLSSMSFTELIVIFIISSALGVLFIIPIGAADMPSVIALLNAFSGVAAAMTGFVLSNNVLIVSGALVGASGIILTDIMCKAMNRSVWNVLFGKVGLEVDMGTKEQKQAVHYTAQDAVVMLEKANSVIIIPGYGLAVAQAQHILQEMTKLLEKRGIKVRYAIHPVAGRMPGHMNILLAEANTPYEQLYEMSQINDDFSDTDVAFIVGANDVVNPAARYKKESVLYGMPILNADQARTIMVLKRSLKPGFAGEDNEIFYNQKTMMVFGDAKDTLTKIVGILKEGSG